MLNRSAQGRQFFVRMVNSAYITIKESKCTSSSFVGFFCDAVSKFEIVGEMLRQDKDFILLVEGYGQ